MRGDRRGERLAAVVRPGDQELDGRPAVDGLDPAQRQAVAGCRQAGEHMRRKGHLPLPRGIARRVAIDRHRAPRDRRVEGPPAVRGTGEVERPHVVAVLLLRSPGQHDGPIGGNGNGRRLAVGRQITRAQGKPLDDGDHARRVGPRLVRSGPGSSSRSVSRSLAGIWRRPPDPSWRRRASRPRIPPRQSRPPSLREFGPCEESSVRRHDSGLAAELTVG